MFELTTAFRNPSDTNSPRTPSVALRVFGTSHIRTSHVASLTLTAILVTKEDPMFELTTAFRNPSDTNSPRTPSVATRVINTSKVIRHVASLTLTAIRVTQEDPMFKLATKFRNPRDTDSPRTPSVATRVIITFKMHTFSVSGAFAMIARFVDTILRILPEDGNSGRSETKALFFAPSATIKKTNAERGSKMELQNVAKGER